ncbi:hypothetical protein HanXRQr2_Chr13g0586371 [Helianthus annuus]|uniref:Uncharacterized protein n=1 Tax=Helianthus annuus TaxID=4232 RepID=A0A9K3HAR3_HELAN|nr:hypothetical protein HanXRQr2_Chr13g0586371 [Helianthus annuus]
MTGRVTRNLYGGHHEIYRLCKNLCRTLRLVVVSLSILCKLLNREGEFVG